MAGVHPLVQPNNWCAQLPKSVPDVQIYRLSQRATQDHSQRQAPQALHEHSPEELAWGWTELPADGIFHFLLPDPGMRRLWRNSESGGWNQRAYRALQNAGTGVCGRKVFTEGADFPPCCGSEADGLTDCRDWAQQLAQLRQRTTDPLPLWEEPGVQEPSGAARWPPGIFFPPAAADDTTILSTATPALLHRTERDRQHNCHGLRARSWERNANNIGVTLWFGRSKQAVFIRPAAAR